MKRKILFITFAFMFILLIFCNNSFASTEIEVDRTTYIMPDWWSEKEYHFFVAFNKDTTYYYYLFASDYPFNITINSSNNYVIKNSNNSDYLYTSNFGSNLKNDFSSSTSLIDNDKGTNSSEFVNNSSYFSTHDIYLDNTLVFQGPVQEITLAQVLETEKQKNPQMVMKEILIILPMTLVVVVSYLGLRKALAMLSAILHRS